MKDAPKIIAEAAQGYEGKPDYCRLLVKAAAQGGADAVKFQCVFADDTAEPGYQYYEWYKSVEMPVDAWRRIKSQAEEAGVMLFIDISGERALEVAHAIRPDGIKLHASNFFNRKLMRSALEISDRLFVSIGGLATAEVSEMLQEAESWRARDRIALLYGFQAEPTPIEKSNLSRLPALRLLFPGTPIGYLDHAPGDSDDKLHISLMAMCLGVDWIEKHLTLSRFLKIQDSVSALEPDEFARYVADIRRLAAAFGVGDIELTEEERAYRDRSVKKLLASRDLPGGHRLGADDFVLKRSAKAKPFEGIHDPRQVIGRTLRAAVPGGQPILAEHLE